MGSSFRRRLLFTSFRRLNTRRESGENRVPEKGLENLPEFYGEHLREWTRRFSDTCRAHEVDGVVIFSGVKKSRFRDDNDYPFFAEPYFKAWVPQSPPNAALKILPGETPLLVRVESADFWHAPPGAPSGFWAEHFDIRHVDSAEALFGELGMPLSGMAAVGEAADEAMGFATVNDADFLTRLDFYRAYKTAYEVACMEEANRIAAAGHAATQTALAQEPSRQSEFDLNQVYCLATRQREAELPYQNIVALNEHGSTLHYQNLDREPPEEFRSFLLDAGAEFNGYASDVTRTVSGSAGEFGALVASMDGLQRRLCSGTRNGVSFIALNDFAHRLLAEVLKEHRLITCSADEAYDLGITRTFLPHGLGHLLGLQVHDAGGRLSTPDGAGTAPPEEHPFLRLTRTLEPGFVVTIEPGLYFIPSLLEVLRNGPVGKLVNWDDVDALTPYGGIRVEDNVLVTDAESRNLSRPALLQSGVS